jgi:MerR family mercuric resistance operon transcriptional regulator
MSDPQSSLPIGALADRVGVTVETIRYYQRRRLLREPARPAGGIRRYTDADVARVHFIKAAQRLGFSLDEVAQMLQLDDGAQCAQARRIATQRLADVRRRLEDLRRIEASLVELVERCGRTRGRVNCPLIESLQQLDGAAPTVAG